MKNLLLFLFLFPCILEAQNGTPPEQQAELKKDILKMDSLLFDVAFNTCDFNLYKTILVDGLEFYDDRTGLNDDIKTDYASFHDKCGRPFSVTRKLISSSVHRLGDYGALQKGTHIFLNDGKVVQSGEFIHIWEKKEDSWIVKRAISYDHTDL
jgi:hypothetical protein